MRAVLRALLTGALFSATVLPALIALSAAVGGATLGLDPWPAFLPLWALLAPTFTLAPPLAVVMFGPEVTRQ